MAMSSGNTMSPMLETEDKSIQRQNKASQEKHQRTTQRNKTGSRQDRDKARKAWARQVRDKTRQDKTGTRQDKTRQDKTIRQGRQYERKDL